MALLRQLIESLAIGCGAAAADTFAPNADFPGWCYDEMLSALEGGFEASPAACFQFVETGMEQQRTSPFTEACRLRS